jgi:hypothetical protein
MSCAGQSLSITQALWQKPLTQVSPAWQSLLKTHARPPALFGWQTPPVHTSPVPQSAAELHAG